MIDYFFLLSSGILLILGADAANISLSIPLSIFNFLFFVGIRLIQNKKMEIPKNFLLYIVFVVFLLLHYLLFRGHMTFFWIFLSGGLFWFQTYNLRDVFTKHYFFVILMLGFWMAALYLFSLANGVKFLSSDNLYLPKSALAIHNHLGDLWAIILLGVIFKMLPKIKLWQIILTTFGLVLIALSFSRSAVLSLGVGLIYTLYQYGYKKISKIVLPASLAALYLFILYFGFYKTTLFARPYFWESIVALIGSPLGLGMSNFSKESGGVILTHNIILEVVLGIGIFSISFLIWIYKIFKSILIKLKNRENILYKATFLSLFVNFCFDTTYIVPTMIWVWFISLGLIANNRSRIDN